MKVSLNTLRQYTEINVSTDELVAKINQQLGQVEEVQDLGKKYKDVLVVRVVECEKHPNADKLSVCKIDDSGARQDVPRDAQGYVQVVCGAPNVQAGMFAAWLPPQSVVPASAEDAAPFVLDAREIRGIQSNGMLAAGDELALNSDHDGIVNIVASDLPPHTQSDALRAGASFAELFDLNDTIIDIENKMFTHRPDCFGQIGVAREIYAITQPEPASDKATDIRFKEEEWYWMMPQFESATGLDLTVTHDAGSAVPRFMAVAIRGVEVQPSPLWLQTTLVRWGAKPINNIVDLTNYLMLLTAQPTHAYDYDKLRGHTLGVRMARSGESVSLLNGKTYQLSDEDIIIVDGQGPVGLAGVMGGKESEVSAETKNVVLECATFDMYTIRKMSMRHGLFTDAVTRFNKGQSSLQNGRIVRRLLDLMPGTQASDVFDLPDHTGKLDDVSVHGSLEVTPSFINNRLGLSLNENAIGNLLRRVNFATYPLEDTDPGSLLSITAPYWRTDIQDKEDVVEEVGRLYGFDKLPRELPKRSIKPAAINRNVELKRNIRESLSRAGANELVTYSFTHERTLIKAEQDSAQAYQLANALSPDLQYYRLSVLPNLLEKVHPNVKVGYSEFTLFEIGKTHNKSYQEDSDGLPQEVEYVDGVYTSKTPHSGAAYYHMRRLVSQLAREFGFSVTFEPIDESITAAVAAPFDLDRSASVVSRSGVALGILGELKPSVRRNFKLPAYTAAFSLNLQGIREAAEQSQQGYQPLSKYPVITQDISLKVTSDTSYDTVFECVYDTVAEQFGEKNIVLRVSPISIYQSANDMAHKTITLHVELNSYEGTLTAANVSVALDNAADVATTQFGAERT